MAGFVPVRRRSGLSDTPHTLFHRELRDGRARSKPCHVPAQAGPGCRRRMWTCRAPPGAVISAAGCRVGIYDIDTAKLERVGRGEMPFRERGADELLARLLPTGRLELSTKPAIMGRSATLMLVIGTPIDEFMNPSTRVFERVV